MTIPDWMQPPRPEGWFSDDLDQLPEAPPHIELIDGALVLRLIPQTVWHSRVGTALQHAITQQAPPGLQLYQGMTITLDERNRLEPDVLATNSPYEPDSTFFPPDRVPLVIEIVSPESAYRDRTVKLRKYAEAGIPSYWCVDHDDWKPVIHVYELDGPTRTYALAAIHRSELRTGAPFPIELDLSKLVPGPNV
jgi:Uma2 family endonuclease